MRSSPLAARILAAGAIVVALGGVSSSQPQPTSIAVGTRVLLDAHNAYPYNGKFTDRIDRALGTGYRWRSNRTLSGDRLKAIGRGGRSCRTASHLTARAIVARLVFRAYPSVGRARAPRRRPAHVAPHHSQSRLEVERSRAPSRVVDAPRGIRRMADHGGANARRLSARSAGREARARAHGILRRAGSRFLRRSPDWGETASVRRHRASPTGLPARD